MGYFISSLKACGRNRLWIGIAVLLHGLLTGGCVQPAPVRSLAVTSTGLDEEGHPIAFRFLPRSRTGDIDWVAALKEGLLDPKASLDATPEPAGSVLNLDIVFNVGDSYPMPHVVFPHTPHTIWLNCNSCHPALFVMKQGANPVSMDRIVKGEYCGRCHGVVAFPIRDCFRCHSRPKTGEGRFQPLP